MGIETGRWQHRKQQLNVSICHLQATTLNYKKYAYRYSTEIVQEIWTDNTLNQCLAKSYLSKCVKHSKIVKPHGPMMSHFCSRQHKLSDHWPNTSCSNTVAHPTHAGSVDPASPATGGSTRSGKTTTCHLPICGDAQSDVVIGRHYDPGWLRVKRARVGVGAGDMSRWFTHDWQWKRELWDKPHAKQDT